MQLSFRKRRLAVTSRTATLVDLKPGEDGVLDRLDLPVDVARRLMELGFLPGHHISAGLSAPGGDPRVFRVDGSEVALRLETAAHLYLRSEQFPQVRKNEPKDRECP